MAIIDEIEELRAELRHCLLSAEERRDAEKQLAELLRKRDEHNAAKAKANSAIRTPHEA